MCHVNLLKRYVDHKTFVNSPAVVAVASVSVALYSLGVDGLDDKRSAVFCA